MLDSGAAWVVPAVLCLILAPAALWFRRVRAAKARRREKADARLRAFCLAAIDFVQDARLAVQAAACAGEGVREAPPEAGEIADIAAPPGPFPARDEILEALRECSEEAAGDPPAPGSAPRSMEDRERRACDREQRVRHYCRIASRGLGSAWRDPPVRRMADAAP